MEAGWATITRMPMILVMTRVRPIPRWAIHTGRVSAPRNPPIAPALSNKPSCVALMLRVRSTRRGSSTRMPAFAKAAAAMQEKSG